MLEGAALFEATAVGPESRAARLTATARAFRHPRSPLERANDRLLLWLVAFSVPLDRRAHRLRLRPRRRRDRRARTDADRGDRQPRPRGLILLISLTAAVSAFKVAQRGVLAQQLNAVESLASVDVVCTDKTGTLTEPTLRVVRLVPAERRRRGDARRARSPRYAAIAPSRNTTLQAIADAELAEVDGGRVVGQVPFSSRRRWSALDLGDERLVLGAPELFASAAPELAEQARTRPAVDDACSRSGASESPLPAAGPSRASRSTCGRLAWSCSPSGCGRTRPRPWRSSPPRTSR